VFVRVLRGALPGGRRNVGVRRLGLRPPVPKQMGDGICFIILLCTFHHSSLENLKAHSLSEFQRLETKGPMRVTPTARPSSRTTPLVVLRVGTYSSNSARGTAGETYPFPRPGLAGMAA